MLRDFLYLNRKLTEQFLAQLEGGLYDEELARTSQTGKKGLSGGLRAPVVDVSAEKGSQHTTENERTVRQTPESQFNRLHGHLAAQDLLSVEAVDESGFATGLNRGDILEVTAATLHVGGFQQFASFAQQLTRLLPLMDGIGATSSLDEASRNQMRSFALLAQNDSTLPVIAEVPGKANLVIAVDLDQQYVLDDISGEAVALVRVIRVLKPGDTHLVGDFTGGLLEKLPKSQQKDLSKAFNTPEARQFGMISPLINYPAFLGTAIAIYR